MRAYHLINQSGTGAMAMTEIDTPEPGPGEVRVRIEAASVNYRDLLVLARAGQGGLDGRIPLSDGAGVVDKIGPNAPRWRVGDRVAASFFRAWISGPFRSAYMRSALGGSTTDGVLADYVVLPEAALARMPEHLSTDEAATLPCAAVTAWHGLVTRGGMKAGDTLLVQGTGGVALFGLQFAAALGARAIVLSSSNEKLEKARALGASILINYRETPEWDTAVMDATNGVGASHILELGGPATYDRSVRAVASSGKIVQIGVLSGFAPTPNLARLQTENADIIGVTVGSVEHFQAMNTFLTIHALRPIIDRIFAFDEAQAALDFVRSGTHFGKIVIRLG
jgi:NADPH:quinone reductase-like Zn-dependent oxidoreductase